MYVLDMLLLTALLLIFLLAGCCPQQSKPRTLLDLKCEAAIYEADYEFVKVSGLTQDPRPDADFQHNARIKDCVERSQSSKP